MGATRPRRRSRVRRLCPLAVLPREVPLLRLQQPRGPRPVDEARFSPAFSGEIAHRAARATRPQAVRSIFFGGGTPSLMARAPFRRVIEEIAKRWPIAPDVEITLEANPTSVEAGRFRGYRAPASTASPVGVQALDDADLRPRSPAQRRGGRHPCGSAESHLPPHFVRPDLRPLRPDRKKHGARELEGR